MNNIYPYEEFLEYEPRPSSADDGFATLSVWERSEDRDIYTKVKFNAKGGMRFEEEDIDWTFADMMDGGPQTRYERYDVPASRRAAFIARYLGPEEIDEGEATNERLKEELGRRLDAGAKIGDMLRRGGFA